MPGERLAHIVATVLFALAAMVAVVPTLGVLIFWARLPSWLDDLSKYQTLFGAPILAASLALIGAVLTSRTQRIISARQLSALRRKQDQTLGLKRHQMASAFIEEIDEILNELNEFLRPAIESQLRAVESSGDAEVKGVGISKYLRRSFDNSSIRVRLFPKPISKGLTRFYSMVEEAKLDLGWYNRVIEIYANHKLRIMTPMRLTRLLEENVDRIKSSEKLGRTLIEELKTIRDAEIESPHQHQTPKHRVWTKDRLRARELLSIWVGKAIH